MRRQSTAKVGKDDSLRVLGGLLGLELLFLVYAFYKGTGLLFLQISGVLMILTVISYLAAGWIGADRYLIIIAIVQLNLGFFIQMLTRKGDSSVGMDMILKCLAAFAAAFLAAFAFFWLARWISLDIMALVIAAVQMALIIALGMFGTVVGEGGQGAKIQLDIPGIGGIQPLEFVKVMYVFAAAILLCKKDRVDKKILGIPRELFFLVYTGMLLISLAVFRELGTALIMFLTAAVMMIIYSSNRKTVWILGAGTLILALLGTGMLILLEPSDGTMLGKVYERIMYFSSPELDASGAGYQGLQMRKALAVGGLFGPDTERYLFPIALEESDMVFAKLVQTCGVVMGFVLLLSFFLLIQRGLTISKNCKDSYFRGTAMGITVLFSMESIIHIAYNTGVGPITGIPLYLVSEGFSATTTGMVMIAILLVISTGGVERSRYNESKIDQRMETFFRMFRPQRRRA